MTLHVARIENSNNKMQQSVPVRWPAYSPDWSSRTCKPCSFQPTGSRQAISRAGHTVNTPVTAILTTRSQHRPPISSHSACASRPDVLRPRVPLWPAQLGVWVCGSVCVRGPRLDGCAGNPRAPTGLGLILGFMPEPFSASAHVPRPFPQHCPSRPDPT